MPDRGWPAQLQLCIYMMGEVLVTGTLFFCVVFLPCSVYWRIFAQLKQHGYLVKHAVFPGFSSSGRKARRISKLCFPLNTTAIADYYFCCFHFLMTIKSWLWVSGWLWANSFALLFMEVKGMWWKRKKKSTAVMKLVESCTMGWITSLPRAFILCWQVVQTG